MHCTAHNDRKGQSEISLTKPSVKFLNIQRENRHRDQSFVSPQPRLRFSCLWSRWKALDQYYQEDPTSTSFTRWNSVELLKNPITACNGSAEISKIQEKLLPNSILYITALTTPLRIIQVPMESFWLKLSNESTTSNFCAMKSREEFKPSTISSHQLSKPSPPR
jgi:hypothetical protein